MKDSLITFFAAAVVMAMLAGIMTLIYNNAIAPEFNLPTFNYFVFYGLYWCVPTLFNGVDNKNKD